MASVTMDTYDIGSVARLEDTTMVGGVLTNPTLVTCIVQDPLGVQTAYTIANGGITNPSVGLFRRDHDLTGATPGVYAYRFTGTGAAQDSKEARFYVQPRLVA